MEFTWGERFFHIFDFQRALVYILYVYVETLDVSYPQIANDLQHCCPKKVANKIKLDINFYRGAHIYIGELFTQTKFV